MYYTAPADKIGRAIWWQRIHPSIALRNASQVTTFRGMVVDFKTNLLKECLMDLPAKGQIFRITEAHRAKNNPIPWAIRQKWAKQIVRGVAQVHDRDKVIAGNRHYHPWVCINQHDDAVVTLGTTGDHPSVHDGPGLLPPECRSEAFKVGFNQITPEFDLSQPGPYL
jgi:hypothetical protein